MSETDHLTHGSRIQVWDGPLRIFHWLLVLSIAVTLRN